jgi:hypothetical protein
MSAYMPSETGGRERDGAKRHQKNLPEHIERCDISRIAFQRWQTLSLHIATIATLLLVYVAEAPSKRLLSRLTRHTGVGVCVSVYLCLATRPRYLRVLICMFTPSDIYPAYGGSGNTRNMERVRRSTPRA